MRLVVLEEVIEIARRAQVLPARRDAAGSAHLPEHSLPPALPAWWHRTSRRSGSLPDFHYRIADSAISLPNLVSL
jgi:hypothetical protein